MNSIVKVYLGRSSMRAISIMATIISVGMPFGNIASAAPSVPVGGSDDNKGKDSAKKMKDILNAAQDDQSSDPLKSFLLKVQEYIPPSVLEGSKDTISKLYTSGIPYEVGYGFLMGYSSGFAVKKISKFVAFTIGTFFVVVQTLSYSGYLDVKYDKLQTEAEKVLDLNKDGKVDMKDAEYAIDNIQKILGFHMPTGGGFATGLLMGLRA
eukprot:gene13455-18047_t